ncbi:MAG: exopolysaccharide biosynthesis polyprenyl glycosylphosphotransferase, partial [Candidatus Latescibacteria bacterium]|nr:exopolysaccharide biosynthesis polyprenyl glycosylphosphotransferase [Candidatus Latescibacterota bacterium]
RMRNLGYKIVERILPLVSDVVMVNISFLFAYWLAFKSGIGGERTLIPLSEYFLPAVLITCYWLILFLFTGLYESWHAKSRLDEFITVSKGIIIGGLILFLATLDISRPFSETRIVFLSYIFSLIVLVGGDRISIRSFQRHLLTQGVGSRRSVIVGGGERGQRLFQQVNMFPALGYQIVGFACRSPEKAELLSSGFPVLGTVRQLPRILKEHEIDAVLIALPTDSHRQILDILSRGNSLGAKFYILPDLYDIVTGQVRTNQIYGFPLVEISPGLMPSWEKKTKRLIDIIISILILFGLAPLWLIVAAIIKLDSKGSVFFHQERVGKSYKMFMLHKFRSMVVDAERSTGPVWAKQNDPRITRFGRFMRRFRIDEVPQLWNVLKGEMSL